MNRSLFRILFFSLIAMSLHSCLVTNKYEQPVIDAAEFARLDSFGVDTTSLADLSWRTFYSDSILQGYIDSAMVHNYDVQIAEKRIDAAHAYFLQGQMAWLPTVDAGTNVTYQKISENSRFGGFGETSIAQYELSVSSSWEADIWGKIKSMEAASEAQYLQSLSARTAVYTQLISQIANTYFQLMAADERKTLIEQTIVIRHNSSNTISALKEAGETTALAVNQAEAQEDEARVLLVQVKNQIYILENTMMLLLGYPLDTVYRNSFSDQPVDPTITVGVPAMLLSNRPDVRMAEYDLRYYFEQNNVAIASFYPSINISATVGLQALNPANWFDINSLFATVIGGLTQPIFQRRKLRTQKEVAQAQMEESYLVFERTVFEAGIEVIDALNDYQTQIEILKVRDEQVESLQFALDNAGELLKGGFADYLEVLSVQEAILNVELQRIDALATRYQSMTSLYRALGGGTK